MDRSFWQEKKYLPYYVSLALLTLLSGCYLSWHNQNLISSLENQGREKELLLAYKENPLQRKERKFLPSLFSKGKGMDYGALLEEAGLYIKDIQEEEGKPTELGQFYKIFISGTGSFAQILSGFDIIKSKESWNAVYLKEIKRNGEGLAFEIEIQTFQYRGTYEKEKYRPDRSDGNGQEQSR